MNGNEQGKLHAMKSSPLRQGYEAKGSSLFLCLAVASSEGRSIPQVRSTRTIFLIASHLRITGVGVGAKRPRTSCGLKLGLKRVGFEVGVACPDEGGGVGFWLLMGVCVGVGEAVTAVVGAVVCGVVVGCAVRVTVADGFADLVGLEVDFGVVFDEAEALVVAANTSF